MSGKKKKDREESVILQESETAITEGAADEFDDAALTEGKIVPLVYLSAGNAEIGLAPKLHFDFSGLISYIKNSRNTRKRPSGTAKQKNSDNREAKKRDYENSRPKRNNNKSSKIKNDDEKNKRLAAAAAAVAGVIAVALIVWGFTRNNAQEVYVNDALVGIIENTDVTGDELYETALAKLKSDTGTNIEVNEKVSVKPVHASSGDIVTEDFILSEICKNFTYKTEAAAIYVNGNQVAVMINEEEAKAVLREIAQAYMENGKELQGEPQFVQDVQVQPKFVSSDELMDKEAVKKILTANTTEEKKYIIQDGDTLFEIALKFDMSVDELIKANPKIGDGSSISIGQELNLVLPVPFLSVKTTEEVSYKETIERDVKEIKNADEYMTYSNIITEGSDGEKEVTAKITKVNGIETGREVISEKVITEPVTQEIEVGTLETPPKRALGNFIYPVQGSFSSGYGSRWGTFHHGLDLAAGYGMPVYASDGGTVTFAGFDSGGYGNLVVIDHGNGFQTKYAHNSSVAVEVGQQVAQGEVIAYVGSTGYSTGNHCHFEVLINGQTQDPLNYLG